MIQIANPRQNVDNKVILVPLRTFRKEYKFVIIVSSCFTDNELVICRYTKPISQFFLFDIQLKTPLIKLLSCSFYLTLVFYVNEIPTDLKYEIILCIYATSPALLSTSLSYLCRPKSPGLSQMAH